MRTTPVLFCLLSFLLSPQARAEEPVNLESLLQEMVDRDAVAQVPAPHYVCRQASSYDRGTVGIDQPGWFANWDRSQFVRVEENGGRKEYVMMDAKGPGAVVRIWGTWHGARKEGGGLNPFSNGTIRFYLDGAQTPAIEGPIADLISGGKLIGLPFSESVAPETNYERRGHNLYLPIPYGSHCKITYESDAIIDFGAQRGEALYYQINYRTYEPNTPVIPFQRQQLEELEPLLNKVGKQLLDPTVNAPVPLSTTEVDIQLPPNSQPLSLARGEGGNGAIYRISVRLQAEDLQQALRSTVIALKFDGKQTGWCPVGDFFGTGHQIHAYRSWYTETHEDGTMQCLWVMPFEKSCHATIQNLGDQPVRVISEANVGHREWDEHSMHFHASWHQLTKVDTGPDKDQTGKGAFDVNYVKIAGQGKIVGDTLTLFNGASAWWGEGDEKIFIDGEDFPSHVGTGTEDYYGYAWCRPEYFQSPFHAQPCGDGNMAGGFSVNSRYRILDALPFTTSIQMDMELWHWRNTKMNFAPATFWYGRPEAVGNVRPDPESAKLAVPKKRSDMIEVRTVPGAIEGESLKILARAGGKTSVQTVEQYRWSGDAQLWWIDGKPKDQLVLAVPVEKTGRYRVTIDLTKAVDYGIVSVSLGDYPPKSFDRYFTRVANDVLELGTLELKEGVAPLTIEIMGANEKAVPRHMFGLDYLTLEAAD